jgi:hypothetical protein
LIDAENHTAVTTSFADPVPFATDPDPAFHFDTDPDPAFHLDTDPDPTVLYESGFLPFQRGNVPVQGELENKAKYINN